MDQITYAVLGYGNRGREFANLLKYPEIPGKLVAVAEPDPDKRAEAAREHGLSGSLVFGSALDLLAEPRMADTVINSTMDRQHAETSIIAMGKGYNLLLEKPMATTLEECRAIEEAQRKSGVVLAVCHSLRYHPVYATIKRMIVDGRVGEVVSLDQLEGVNYIHQSHSYVRGNWSNEGASSFMLLAKSCHDIDLLTYLAGRPCRQVSSFGSLTHFSRANMPVGAPRRCLDGCPAEFECPYHCVKVYVEDPFWRVHFPKRDDASVMEYLRTGPYGRCVYQCDNDAVDHQVVNLEYEGGLTATFTMTAFHPGGRQIRVHGTKGFMEGWMETNTIVHHDFISGSENTMRLPRVKGSHGGGDYRILRSMTDAVLAGDPLAVLTTAQESLVTHSIVFAAETARRERRVVRCDELR